MARNRFPAKRNAPTQNHPARSNPNLPQSVSPEPPQRPPVPDPIIRDAQPPLLMPPLRIGYRPPSLYRIKSIRIYLVLFLALRYEWPNTSEHHLAQWVDTCRLHHKWCPICFDEGMTSFSCLSMANRVYVDNSLLGIVTAFLTKKRGMQYATYQNQSAVIKNTMDQQHVDSMRNIVCQLTDDIDVDCDLIWAVRSERANLTAMLTARFVAVDAPGSVKITPLGAVRKFLIDFGAPYHNSVRAAMQLNSNPEPLLLRTLRAKGFPVPKILLECGFVMVQAYEGLPLYRFYRSKFSERLFLAKQMLDAAFLFTEGWNGFRIYLTDVTYDNVVVNTTSNKVTFVDLDGVVVVYSKLNPFSADLPAKAAKWDTVHRAELMPCDNCFAYSEIALQTHHKSDHNLYAVCSLFAQDVNGNVHNGLLHSIPAKITQHVPDFKQLLSECFHCGGRCKNRFAVAHKLLTTIELTLESL